MLPSLRNAVLDANRALGALGLAPFTFGNASAIDRDRGLVVIKPSGVAYDAMTAADLVITDLSGNVVNGKLRPSSDLATHLVLYRAFDGIGGVVHTHSHFATAWAQARREIPCFGTTHADYFHGPVPLTEDLSADEIVVGIRDEHGHGDRPPLRGHRSVASAGRAGGQSCQLLLGPERRGSRADGGGARGGGTDGVPTRSRSTPTHRPSMPHCTTSTSCASTAPTRTTGRRNNLGGRASRTKALGRMLRIARMRRILPEGVQGKTRPARGSGLPVKPSRSVRRFPYREHPFHPEEPSILDAFSAAAISRNAGSTSPIAIGAEPGVPIAK